MKLNENIEKDIKKNSFLDYQEYAEIRLLTSEEKRCYCWKCNKEKRPLTYLDMDFYYLPCWDCVSTITRKKEKQEIIMNIQNAIKDFYFRILGDRYFQLFVVDDIYFKNTVPHDYKVFKDIINSINPPSRNDIWFLDWVPGFPKIISTENFQGLKTVNLSHLYSKIEISKDKVQIGDYTILPPEVVGHDSKHYSRYNILNKTGDRKTKRFKVGDCCYRFYNTQKPGVKSIFRLQKNGEDIVLGSLSYQDYVVLKLGMMRNKAFLRIIFDIILEMMKFMGVYQDSIFLKNTILIDPEKESTKVKLTWNSLEEPDPEFTNISIF